uniref:Uncharacterized protein n=1 Tax=Anguilla anguilla TaxID=7936 RepID=A0A0E9XHC9_ANGAN
MVILPRKCKHIISNILQYPSALIVISILHKGKFQFGKSSKYKNKIKHHKHFFLGI